MTQKIHQIDRDHIWHPYSAMNAEFPSYIVSSASGVRLKLDSGQELIDGMSSWWSVIHGYNHPALNQALIDQSQKMSHVMFGGLTHEPATELAQRLVDITPEGLSSVFLADSGSVAVEVAMKLAIQFWNAKGETKRQKFLTIQNGYHGDTFGAMSVCDPVTGMHSLFSESLSKQYFAPAPKCRFDDEYHPQDIEPLIDLIDKNGTQLAAIILEPIVQGAGGMRIYSKSYLTKVREICDTKGLLLIADEIATGFGRTGALFACDHAGISPDIMCVGKALTGGYMTLAATMTTKDISQTIDSGDPGVFMHGPTFMGNPLACALASCSIDLLIQDDWASNINRIHSVLTENLDYCNQLSAVEDVRTIGAIGVVELKQPVDMSQITKYFVSQGVWIRPFGRLVYLMPPYIISDKDLRKLCSVIYAAIKKFS